MPSFESPHDGARLFYRDYRPWSISQRILGDLNGIPKSNTAKPAIILVHGWPLSSKMFEHLAVPLCEDHKFRCILPDRRGFGKSEWSGSKTQSDLDTTNFDTFADDLIYLIESLKLPNGFVLAGASMGTGEIVRAVTRSKYLRDHCKGMIFIGTNLPLPLQGPDNPTAPPRELWGMILNGFRNDRGGFTNVSLPGVFGAQAGIEVPASQLARFERIVEDADALAIERCVNIFVHADFRNELRDLAKLSPKMPLLMLHGDSDQGVSLESGPNMIQKLVPHAELKVYEKAAHGLYLTHADQCQKDIMQFVAAVSSSRS